VVVAAYDPEFAAISTAAGIWAICDIILADSARFRACDNEARTMVERIAIIAITTNNSINVNPEELFLNKFFI
jgi:hypothetical protein